MAEKLLRLACPHETPAGINGFYIWLYTTTACWLLLATWASTSSFLKASNICHVKKKIGLYFVLSLSQTWSLPPKFDLIEGLFCSEPSRTVSILWETRAQNFSIIPLVLKIYFSSTFCFPLFSLVTLNLNSILCVSAFTYVSWM